MLGRLDTRNTPQWAAVNNYGSFALVNNYQSLMLPVL